MYPKNHKPLDTKSLICQKNRGKKGEGRAVKFTPINIPIDVAEDLKLYRDIYSEIAGCKITLETVLRSWMEMANEQDPDIYKAFIDAKKSRQETQERLAAGLGLTAEQLTENESAFDPTAPEIEPWNLRYFFEKDGEEVEAHPYLQVPFFISRLYVPFYAILDNRNIGMKQMLAEGWTLMNDIGCEINIEQAQKICSIIKEHCSVSHVSQLSQTSQKSQLSHPSYVGQWDTVPLNNSFKKSL